MKRLILSICLLVLIFNLQAQTGITQYRLENGLTVILQPDKSQNEVFGMVVAKVGAKDDPATATGLAHYMEHMLFKGTKEIGTIDWNTEKPFLDSIIVLYDTLAQTTDEELRKSIQKKINDLSLKANDFVINNELWSLLMQMGGTNLNAGTGPDATYYFNSFPPGQIEKWLEIYSHRFIEPIFRGFQAELEVVYEEKNMYSDQFFSVLLEKFNYHFFKNHPYGQQSIIGTIDHLKNPQLSKMIEFYETYYVANNMALVLVGDFDLQKVQPIIEEKFNRLKSKPLPERKVFDEQAFNGREFHSGRYSPIKLGILGYRTVPKLHEHKIKLELVNGILSNSGSNGLLDRLVLDNKLMAAMVIDMPYQDHGSSIVFFIPKIVGQSLSKAEKLILSQLDSLKAGNFDESLLESLKLEKYRDFQTGLENNTERAMLLADAFISGEKLERVFDYPERILAVTKEEIVRLANLYYSDNFLAFHSKMGLPKSEKIEKPGYEPVISNRESKSDYVALLESLPGGHVEYEPVNFDADVEIIEMSKTANLHLIKNPINDIFSLEVQFQVGEKSIPELAALSTAIAYAGARNYSPLELKTAFANLGTTVYTGSSDNYFSIYLKGPDKYFAQVVVLLNEYLNTLEFNKTAVEKIWEEEALNRKMEAATPQAVSYALLEFAKYGNQSGYLDRLSKKELKKIKSESLKALMDTLKTFPVKYHFVSTIPGHEAAATLNRSVRGSEKSSKAQNYFTNDLKSYQENTIFFVNDKKALQSNIHFYIEGEDFIPSQKAALDAFNTYFGGSFSGIVMQEIREFRSLSYAASGTMVVPSLKGKKTHYSGYVGTQADKTLEALEVYTDLLKNLPEKPERIDMIKDYLVYSGQMRKPSFRNRSTWIQRLQTMGYDQDPYEFLKDAYRELDFSQIQSFHKDNIAGKPIVIVIVGDKKRIDMKELSKYGQIVEKKKKELFSK